MKETTYVYITHTYTKKNNVTYVQTGIYTSIPNMKVIQLYYIVVPEEYM